MFKFGQTKYMLLAMTLVSIMVSCTGAKSPGLVEGVHTPSESNDLALTADPAPTLDSEIDFDAFEDEFQPMPQKKVFDPLSGYNRAMTRFNDKFFDWVLEPASKGYNDVVPKGGRTAVSRFFKNLFFPIRLANNILQVKYDEAAGEIARFVLNTTVGFLGFFDPAESWFHLEAHPEDFGQTLAVYGAGSGFHIVLPFLGPSNLRDTIGLAPDFYAAPLTYLPEVEVAFAIESYRRLNDASLRPDEYKSIRKDALDFYIFLRDAYEQQREAQIKE